MVIAQTLFQILRLFLTFSSILIIEPTVLKAKMAPDNDVSQPEMILLILLRTERDLLTDPDVTRYT